MCCLAVQPNRAGGCVSGACSDDNNRPNRPGTADKINNVAKMGAFCSFVAAGVGFVAALLGSALGAIITPVALLAGIIFLALGCANRGDGCQGGNINIYPNRSPRIGLVPVPTGPTVLLRPERERYYPSAAVIGDGGLHHLNGSGGFMGSNIPRDPVLNVNFRGFSNPAEIRVTPQPLSRQAMHTREPVQQAPQPRHPGVPSSTYEMPPQGMHTRQPLGGPVPAANMQQRPAAVRTSDGQLHNLNGARKTH